MCDVGKKDVNDKILIKNNLKENEECFA